MSMAGVSPLLPLSPLWTGYPLPPAAVAPRPPQGLPAADRFQSSSAARTRKSRTAPPFVGSFDWQQWMRTQPSLNMPPWRKVLQTVTHPQQYLQLKARLSSALSAEKPGSPFPAKGTSPRFGNSSGMAVSPVLPGYTTQEDPAAFQQMYNRVSDVLDPDGREALENLLRRNILQDTRSDDGHSTLYHLYGILTTGRRSGYDNKTILKETVEILNAPAVITQKFGPLSEKARQRLLEVGNNPHQKGSYRSLTGKLLRDSDLNVENSATCVASSLMYYMADKEPGELARQINELTSPMNAFFEKVRPEEISPDDPSQAERMLRERNVPFYESAPGEWVVKVENPLAGQLRAVDSQRYFDSHRYRNGVESAYQSAVTRLATSSYDPATDFRDSETPGEASKGLTEAEKTLMETIVKENGGVQSVTYQAVAGKATSDNETDSGDSCLYGYKRSFEQTTSDLLQALRMGEPVIVGTTDTDPSGAIVTGHELTIAGAWTDPADNQLKFIVADSDDNIPTLVTRSARELIPTIHHAGMPLKLASKIQDEIRTNTGSSYLVPDAGDASRFHLLHRETAPMPITSETETPDVHTEMQANQPTRLSPGFPGYAANPVLGGSRLPNGYAMPTAFNPLIPFHAYSRI